MAIQQKWYYFHLCPRLKHHRQQEGATRTALLAAAGALLALTGRPMVDRIRAVTVGTGQDLDDHGASPSCGCFGAAHLGHRS
jgi:hypothetical protein